MAAPFGRGREEFDPIAQFRNTLRGGRPWDSIVDFATHKSFCNRLMYPKQLTLLKLIYLETEMMTDYDLETINGWCEGFKDSTKPIGVQPDVWERVAYLKDNGFDHFMQVLAVMGRRASKGIIGGVIGTERLAHFYSLDSWQGHFGFHEGTVGELIVVATSLSQAARRQFRDIRTTVQGCEYLKRHMVGSKYTEFSIQTPGDLRYIDRLQSEGVPIDPEFASLYAAASSSISTSQRGGSSFANFYDEMAHMLMGTGSTKTGEEIYEAYQPSLDQFGIHGITYIPSSPFTMVGKFYELYEDARVLMPEYYAKYGRLESKLNADGIVDIDDDDLMDKIADPTQLIVQLPSWALYEDWETSTAIPRRKGRKPLPRPFKGPFQYSPDGTRPENVMQRMRKRRNPAKFRVEREGQFAAVEDAYLDENKVEAMFAKPWWRQEPLEEQARGYFSIAYRAHADPSRTNANFAFALGHIEDAPCTKCGWTPTLAPAGIGSALLKPLTTHHKCTDGTNGHVFPHVIIDKMRLWKPEEFPEHTIDYVTIGEELDKELGLFASTRKMTYDQYNSAGFISAQKRKFPNIRIAEKTFTVQENQDRFEKFKSALNLGLVHSYIDEFGDNGTCLLSQELRFLQEKNGKVDKMDNGPVTTKDLADAVMVVVVDLLHEHLDRWYIGANRAVFGSTMADPLRSGREFERMALAGVSAPSNARTSSSQDRTFASQRGQSNRERLNENRTNRARQRAYAPGRSRGRMFPNR